VVGRVVVCVKGCLKFKQECRMAMLVIAFASLQTSPNYSTSSCYQSLREWFLLFAGRTLFCCSSRLVRRWVGGWVGGWVGAREGGWGAWVGGWVGGWLGG
jgi:hypothetical protein